MDSCRLAVYAIFVALLPVAVAYDALDPKGNITIKWDIISWAPDGYVAVVTLSNFQMYRQIISPGWTMGWAWAKKEVIWSVAGAQATDQGNCSEFKTNIPHSCNRNPTLVDLDPQVQYSKQFGNCCKDGILSSWGQDSSATVSSFQLSVGLSGTSIKTVRLPENFTLLGPAHGYTCSRAMIVKPSVFISSNGRRKTYAMMTWNVVCTYSQVLASKYPSCCVSMSSFYNAAITSCPSCSCGCPNENDCVLSGSSEIQSVERTNEQPSLLQCTNHMCPIRVHWHVKQNYRKYWKVKMTITNFKYQLNFTKWTLVVEHPSLNIARVYRFNYKPLNPYKSASDSGMFYGIKFSNDVLNEAGLDGVVHSEMVLKKDMETFTLNHGWAFPRKVYFNGDECKMPLPDEYPLLPSHSHIHAPLIGFLGLVGFLLLQFVITVV